MPKSREQKRIEAIERKSRHLATCEAALKNAQECYVDTPTEFRKRIRDEAERALARLRRECGLNETGK